MNWPRRAQILAVVFILSGPLPVEGASWISGAGFRFQPVEPAATGQPGFTRMAAEATGLRFTNELRGDMFLTNAVAHNGSGVALGDVDGDGRVDIYLCSLQGPNRLYRNSGNWRFEEMEAGAAACADQLSTGAAFADADGDGDLDLLVNGIAAGTRLFLNDGQGHFTEATDSGLSRTSSPTSLALADIDGDGDLDLYCTHYIDVMHLADPTTRFAMARKDGKWEVTKVNGESTRSARLKDRFEALPNGSVRELPEVDGFYRNDGKGHFTAIQNESGVFQNERGEAIPPFRDWGLAVMFRDVNGDGAPDLYVCNDNASPSRLWINTGDGHFRLAGHDVLRHLSRSSMGVDFADINRDGWDDFFVLDMFARDPARRMMQLVKDHGDPAARESAEEQPRFNRNTLYLGRGEGSFAETALMAGVAASDWSWCPIFVDVDLDGYEDLLVSNGFSFDVMNQDSHDQLRQRKLTEEQRKRSRQFHPAWPTANAAFHNKRDGTFEPAAEAWHFDQTGISYGMALADLDGDGDLDVVVNNLNEGASVYRNDGAAARIGVRLKGRAPNTSGIGARVSLVSEGMTQSQEMICGGRYMSGDEAMRVFAAGAGVGKLARLEVRWRGGAETVVTDLAPNRIYEIEEPAGGTVLRKAAREPVVARSNLFTDASGLVQFADAASAFDDWARQPLLPFRPGWTGPALVCGDLNGDGWDDIVVTGGPRGALFINERGTGFVRQEFSVGGNRDMGAAAFWKGPAGEPRLLVALPNAGLPGQESEIAVLALTNHSVATIARLPAGSSSAGPLAVADIDQDGDLDLFVGGRMIPGRYPAPAASSIWLNDHGALRRSEELSAALAAGGLVSGAVFADLDGDGRPDLALSCEWGPIRVFRNEKGHFREMTEPWGLAGERGWWTSLVAGDFDGDGRMDLAAGNLGRNTEYQLYGPGPWRLYYGDADRDGVYEIAEAWLDGKAWRPMRNRNWLARGLPDLPRRFPTHAAFAQATIAEVFGPDVAANFVEMNQVESSIFLNRGSHFERRSLPAEAQWTPAMAVCAGDLDGDGAVDLLIGQNFFGMVSDITREDSGCGLWLRGNGKGEFGVAENSGLKILGETRSAALSDMNHDGHLDALILENHGPMKLYLNQSK